MEILLAEDERVIRKSLTEILEPNGYGVRAAETARWRFVSIGSGVPISCFWTS